MIDIDELESRLDGEGDAVSFYQDEMIALIRELRAARECVACLRQFVAPKRSIRGAILEAAAPTVLDAYYKAVEL